MSNSETTPAEMLSGRTLPGGWKVLERVPKLPGATGGHFSIGYVVTRGDGRRGFLKALDYSGALSDADPARALQALTEAFNFERDVLSRCRERNLDRIVVAIEDGTITLDATTRGGPVQYIIFELADGDVRSYAVITKRFDLAWSLRALHHVATGLRQLHSLSIAHQDLKPSNVLRFGDISKLSDLGRAAYKGHTPPHEGCRIAGDWSYAPPELLYNYIDPDWNRRRLGCDAYLLGSMVVFFFSGVAATPLVQAQLDPSHRCNNWRGFYHEVLPYVREAFARTLESIRGDIDEAVREDICGVILELCEPDPALRGHPKERRGLGNQFSLERYVSRFDLLARRAELGLFGIRKS